MICQMLWLDYILSRQTKLYNRAKGIKRRRYPHLYVNWKPNRGSLSPQNHENKSNYQFNYNLDHVRVDGSGRQWNDRSWGAAKSRVRTHTVKLFGVGRRFFGPSNLPMCSDQFCRRGWFLRDCRCWWALHNNAFIHSFNFKLFVCFHYPNSGHLMWWQVLDPLTLYILLALAIALLLLIIIVIIICCCMCRKPRNPKTRTYLEQLFAWL